MTAHLKWPRAVIYVADIQKILGRCPKTARNILQKIRRKHRKRRHQYVTIPEFCAFTGVAEAIVHQFIH